MEAPANSKLIAVKSYLKRKWRFLLIITILLIANYIVWRAVIFDFLKPRIFRERKPKVAIEFSNKKSWYSSGHFVLSFHVAQ